MSNTNNIFLETAWEIGTSLMNSSIWHNNKQCNWTGNWIDLVDGEYKVVTRSFGPDFYSGTSGIAHFLVCLYKETNDALLKKTIEGTIEQIRGTMHHAHDHGFYSGKAGIASTLVDAGNSMQREDWVKEGIYLLDKINTTTIRSHEIDVVSGVAGTIPVLLNFYERFNIPKYLDMAVQLGDVLCNKADKQLDQWSWATVPSHKNLTGFSHGASGIANGLLQLYTVTGNKTYYTAAAGGFKYEQQQFDASQQNWPDYREGVASPQTGKCSCGNAWCHGAPGIALSRLDAQKHTSDHQLKADEQIALRTTATTVADNLANGLTSTNFSLCHGIAGNADVLLQSNQQHYIDLARAAGIAGIQQYRNKREAWPSGLNGTQYTPGIMMGIAGTGHFYLRLHNPQETRTVLLPQL